MALSATQLDLRDADVSLVMGRSSTVARPAEPEDAAPAGGTTSRSWLWPMLAIIAVVYLATATWSQPYNVDAFTNAIQARSFAAGDGVILPEYEEYTGQPYRSRLLWVVDSPDGPTSQYPPGVALWGSLFYLADSSQSVEAIPANLGEGPTEIELAAPSVAPATVAGVASVVIAMLFLGLILSELLSPTRARAALAAAALGTGAWSVASDSLWQHGPAMMLVLGGLYAASRDRFALGGLAFAAAVLVRPHTALIAAGVGLTTAIKRREVRPALAMGSTAAAGLAALVIYNRVVWGELSVAGGYSDAFTDRLTSFTPLTLLDRFVGFFIDLEVGILVFSPILVISLLGLPKAVRRAPDWMLGGALGGLAYLAVQFQANRLSGGEGFFGYRYPLEALAASAPLLVIAAYAWIGDDERRQRMAIAFAVLSIAMHAFGSVATEG